MGRPPLEAKMEGAGELSPMHQHRLAGNERSSRVSCERGEAALRVAKRVDCATLTRSLPGLSRELLRFRPEAANLLFGRIERGNEPRFGDRFLPYMKESVLL